ncbi:MAG: 23S rRNA (uracil(1939)-C(5))-methyltransferase RlmD [Caldimicrobium thiodismutans]|uniref:23S rRNA (Uracil(1939)-C(5))-methyltransferase RlmD n=1 Tax=Caldimicrobium thiodismutans TaxID=1653476 RepID=A0A2N7PLL0_9BACT|nr:MAG: 23S rRNA (uracil(1939)-C(5))-methyltransferase RlmD [Caldimicrobium thiodismutans]
MKQETVIIEKVLYGGDGLARLSSGKVVFVPYTLPQEKVKIVLLEEYKDYAVGYPLEIIEPSPERIPPPCKYYGLCGGCQFQHLPYERELEIKRDILKELFLRQGFKGELPLKGIIPSPKVYHYRNRLRLHVENHIFKMGFVKRGTHEVLKIEGCLLGDKLLNEVLQGLYENTCWINMAFYVKRLRLELSPLDSKVCLLFWTILPPEKRDLKELTLIPSVKSIFYFIKGARPKGPYPEQAPHAGRRIFQGALDLIYYSQPGVFNQVNWEINLEIIKKICELAGEAERVLDLHSGMGNFLLPLVKHLSEAKEFLGVDTDIRAIEDGIYTAEKNELNGRLELRKMSALEALYEAFQEGKTFDLVLLDPPRGGCKELMRLLPEVASHKIIYISCDPPTLIRDILLLQKEGFELKELYLFDMFPRTYHFEVLSLLQRRA